MRKLFFLLVGGLFFVFFLLLTTPAFATTSCSSVGQCIQSGATCPTGYKQSIAFQCSIISENSASQCCVPSSCTDPKIGGTCVTHSQNPNRETCSTGTHQDDSFTCKDGTSDCCLPDNTPLGNTTYRCLLEGGSAGQDGGGNTFISLGQNPTNVSIACAADQICANEVVETDTGFPCVKKADVSCTCGDNNTYSCNKNISGSCGIYSCDTTVTQGIPCSVNAANSAAAPCAEGLNASGTPVPGVDANGNRTKDADTIVKCTKINTAVGAINLLPGEFIGRLVGLVLGIAGGVALLLIIFSGYNLALSQGNPEKIKEGRERLTAALIGLVFIIFAAVILQIIGVNVLGLSVFSK